MVEISNQSCVVLGSRANRLWPRRENDFRTKFEFPAFGGTLRLPHLFFANLERQVGSALSFVEKTRESVKVKTNASGKGERRIISNKKALKIDCRFFFDKFLLISFI